MRGMRAILFVRTGASAYIKNFLLSTGQSEAKDTATPGNLESEGDLYRPESYLSLEVPETIFHLAPV